MSASLDYPQKHLISADEYLRMGEGGVFAPDARLELIEGEIIEMAPIHPPHAGCVKTLNKLLSRRAADKALVSVQDPVIASTRSVPQPDLMLLKPRADDYWKSHPVPAEVFLAIEISDATLDFDLGIKVPLYAGGGIPEVWVVDVNEREVHVFRDPMTVGYRTTRTLKPGESLACVAVPEAKIEVAELFGA